MDDGTNSWLMMFVCFTSLYTHAYTHNHRWCSLVSASSSAGGRANCSLSRPSVGVLMRHRAPSVVRELPICEQLTILQSPPSLMALAAIVVDSGDGVARVVASMRPLLSLCVIGGARCGAAAFRGLTTSQPPERGNKRRRSLSGSNANALP